MNFCQHCQRWFTNKEDFRRHTEQGVLYDNPGLLRIVNYRATQ